MKKRFPGLRSKAWARLSCMTVMCGMLAKDACLGGGSPPPRSPDPEDAGRDAAADTGRDAMLRLPLDTSVESRRSRV
jgi:hypothetical protein